MIYKNSNKEILDTTEKTISFRLNSQAKVIKNQYFRWSHYLDIPEAIDTSLNGLSSFYEITYFVRLKIGKEIVKEIPICKNLFFIFF